MSPIGIATRGGRILPFQRDTAFVTQFQNVIIFAMKRLLLVILTIVFISAFVRAQTAAPSVALTDEQWLPIYQALESEDWDTAESLSSKYLDELKQEDAVNTLGRLRYMYLFSAAGRIAAGKMSYDELEKRIKGFAGKEIVFPGRFLRQKCQDPAPADFNTVCKSDGPHDIMITSTGRTATTIHSFEYIKLKEKFDWAKNNGKVAAIIGTIGSIVPNPNKSRLLVMRIYVIDAHLIVKDAP